MIIKGLVIRFASLIVPFIIGAMLSTILAAHLVAPQRAESVIQHCRANCNTAYKDCRIKANGDGPKKEECEIQYRRCRTKCIPVRSPGE